MNKKIELFNIIKNHSVVAPARQIYMNAFH